MSVQVVALLGILVVGVSGRSVELQNELRFHQIGDHNPDVGLRVPQLIAKYGYPVESHIITTEDGYLLTAHRIPHGINNKDEKDKPVIFLMHGLLCSSADWVLMGPESGLAYLLADRGYDVWLGNARGNYYSRQHVKYDADMDKEFWDFSWHEIGFYDLPAMIDHALNQTGQDQLSYVGHSQGTTAFFVMASTRTEYNDKIRVMVAFAPVAYVDHIPNQALRIISKFTKVLKWITDYMGMYEFLPSTTFMQLIGQLTCNQDSPFKPICTNVIFLIAGYDTQELNATALPVIISNTPAGSSTGQIVHYAQEINSGNFQQYDFGSKKNREIYGTKNPPLYNINQITAPVVLYYGNNDKMTSEKDVERLRKQLRNPILKYKVKNAKWTHLDFLWAIDVVEQLYTHVFDMLERF